LADRTFNTVGGADTFIIFEFSYFDKDGNRKTSTVYMGSIISLSYSTYRNKKSVFNLGQHTIDGFSIGERYVAGTLIKTMFIQDEFAGAINNLKKLISDDLKFNEVYSKVLTPRQFNNLMADDLISCNIIILYSSEYTGEIAKEVIYDATFINNGQVMSINDIITETTISYVAKDIKVHHDIYDELSSTNKTERVFKASELIIKI
jgi:hypothetical protein